MSGVTITFDLEQMSLSLRALSRMGHDPGPLLEDIGGELETSTVLRFETNIAPDGTPWEPSQRALDTDSPTLVDTTRLRDSIHPEVFGSALELGSNVVYAAIHQGGGEIEFSMGHTVEMPERAYLGLSANDNETIFSIVGDHYYRAVGGW